MQSRWTAVLAATLLTFASGQAGAAACIVHTQAERLDVKVCQENVSVPDNLFKDGICKPQLAGQKVEVQFVEQCPTGAFGVCRNAKVTNMHYLEHIHYYGVASDAAYLKPFCEGQSQGQWQTP